MKIPNVTDHSSQDKFPEMLLLLLQDYQEGLPFSTYFYSMHF
jgi:hypothetical protein